MLQEIRLKRGLSQSQLSKKCGVPIQTIQKYEGGFANINNAKLSSLIRICLALNCELKDILTDQSLIDLIEIHNQKQGA